MGRHLLREGKDLIGGLQRFGKALKYWVEIESPVTGSSHASQSIDVAWFQNQGDRFPLMIFEVESRATNAASSNALKVFSKSSDVFEKPLFFFHIFLVSGQTSRIDDLRAHFGSHNYRVYQLDKDGKQGLVSDVLSQHRRIREHFELLDVAEALSSAGWSGVDLSLVVRKVEELQFAGGTQVLLPVYLRLSKGSQVFWSQFMRVLLERDSEGKLVPSNDRYDSYIGQQWAAPICLGLLANELPAQSLRYLQALQNWQSATGRDQAIEPGYASYGGEYGEFIRGLAAPLWVLIAALFKKCPTALDYIGKCLDDLVAAVASFSDDVYMFTALWSLHLAIQADRVDAFEHLRHDINARGGISHNWLIEPPSTLPEEPWVDDNGPRIALADFDAIRQSVLRANSIASDPVSVGRDALIADETMFNWAPRLVAAVRR